MSSLGQTRSVALSSPQGIRQGGRWCVDWTPMLAVLSGLPPDPSLWAFEYKWDGMRALVYCDRHGTRLVSRNRLDVSGQYPDLSGLHRAARSRPCILDGEIVALDDHGLPSFGLLQPRMHVSDPAVAARLARRTPVVYLIFDLLYWDKRLLLPEPYEQRRRQLDRLSLQAPAWQTPPAYPGEGLSTLNAATAVGLEGIMAKRLDSPYVPGGRSDAWRKIKTRQRQEFVIGGWTPLKVQGHRAMGALLVGYHEAGRLRYAGKVGTGFSDDDRHDLMVLLEKRRRSGSPFSPDPHVPAAIYTQPDLVAEVAFHEWTRDGLLRQPAFQGLREDKPARQVVRETAVREPRAAG